MSRNLAILLVFLFTILPAAPQNVSAAPTNVIQVTTAVDEEASFLSCSLREAIIAANTDGNYFGCLTGSGADTITFAGDYTITLTGQLPAVTTPITIIGNGPAHTFIQADALPNVAAYRAFQVTSTGNLTLREMTIRNGKCAGACAVLTSAGGAILNYQGSLTLKNVSLEDNTSSTSGGAVYSYNGFAQVSDTTFLGNTAGTYGGAMGTYGPATVDNSTFFENTGNNGGALYINGPLGTIITVTNSTLYSNFAYNLAGGIYADAVLKLRNSILSNSDGGDCYANIAVGQGIHNLFKSTTTNVTCGIANVVNSNKLGADPLLGPLGDHGGSTQTLVPAPNSPAIDAASNSTCAAPTVGNLDQRGILRPIGAICDIGSVEALRLVFLPAVQK